MRTETSHFEHPTWQPLFSFVLDHFDEEIRLSDLAMSVQLTDWALCRGFCRDFGISPMKWLWRFRTMLAGECLKLSPDWQLTDISVLCGFSSLAHFSRLFRTVHGLSPSEFRRHCLDAVNPAAGKFRESIAFVDLSRECRGLLETVVRASLAHEQIAG